MNAPGSFIQKSYVSTMKYDKDGKPVRETYQAQSIRQTDKDGRRIQESQQAYQNTKTGIEKASHERLFNEKGHKIVKARNKLAGEEYEHNYFKGMNEGDLGQFDNEYNDYRRKVNFGQNYKMLNNRQRGTNNQLPSSK
jgi:hypothetical protein